MARKQNDLGFLKPDHPLDVRSAFSLTLLGVVGGFAIVTMGSSVVRSAHAEDSDIFGFLRQAFGPPPAVQRYEPTYEAPPRLNRRRQAGTTKPHGRRETLRQIRRDRRLANGVAGQSAWPRYVSLPTNPPKVAFTPVPATPDFSGTVDATFVRDENQAYRQALAGKGASGWLNARRTMCVRLCDGYAFPVGQLGSLTDLSLHQTSCSTSCPGAETALFTLAPGEEDVTEARSLSGKSYGSLRTALAYRQKQVPACSCHGAGQVTLPRLPFSQDRTLRPGDIIAGTRSAYVLTGGKVPRYVSLRQDRSLSRPVRQQLEHAFGVPMNEKVRVQLSNAPVATGNADSTAPGAVRVVMPSPY